MHDGMPYDLIQGHSEGHGASEVLVKFLLSVFELLFLSLTVEALQGKMCQDSLVSGGVGQFERRFQGEGVVAGEYFLVYYKTRHILLSNSANCTALHAFVLTQYQRVTDGWTLDRQTGIAVASTALAMRAFWRAVKTEGILVSEA